VISEAQIADSGQYHLVTSNPLQGSTTASASVVVTADTNPPTVLTVTGLGTPNANGPTPYLVKVLFDKRVDPVTAGSSANYVITPAVTVSSVTALTDEAAASLGADWREVILVTSGLTPGQKYSLTVSGVKDQAQTPNTIVPAATSFWAPVLTPGVLAWDYYYLGSVSDITALTGDPNYPNAPETNATLTVFDTDQITGGDLNNDPAFGSLGDDYGDSLSGWITPAVSGDYTFFLAGDDYSELFLSTDATTANAQLIASEYSANSSFQEPPAVSTSSPITLTAGTPYFIQTLHVENGGGDYVKVAWRISTNSTPAANLKPIPAQFLSGYASAPPPSFSAPVLSAGHLTISWTGTGTLYQSTDLKTWTPVAGNPTSPFVVTPGSSPELFYRLEQ
jgi:hypothetical protein